MNVNLLIIVAVPIFVIALMYLVMFLKMQVMYMQLWSFAIIAYCFSILCMFFYINTEYTFLLELRKLLDMTNLLLILFGTYSLLHIKVPSYWYRFLIYMLLLASICSIYEVELLSFYLPVSVYELIMVVFICFNIIHKWDVALNIKIISSFLFFTWGLYKSCGSIVEVFYGTSLNITVIELMFSNILNICILFLYIVNKQEETALSSTMYKTIVEESRDIIFLYQFIPYRAFKYATPSVNSMTGYPLELFYSDPDILKKMASSEALGIVNDMFDPDNDHEDTNIVQLVRANGEEFWAEFDRCIIKNGDKIIAMECTIRDVTDIHSAQMEQIKATQVRNTLMSYISHEMRTPITSIAGYLNAIQDGVMSGEDEINEALDIISTKTLTLKALIDDLDQLTKLETNQFKFDFMMINAGELVEHLIRDNLSDAESKNFEINIETDIQYISKFWVIIDYLRINQIFTNLVNNAFKYASIVPKMLWSFSLDPHCDNLIISVKDYGPGIRAKDIPYIFDKFYRAENHDKRNIYIEGRGLGLTLCKEMINAHHGEIYVESVEGEGSTFTFIIPLYKED